MQLNKISLIPWIAATVACTVLAVSGCVSGNGTLLATGLTVGTFLFMLIPVLHIRNRKVQRMREKTDLLLQWEYASYQAEDIAARQSMRVRKRSIAVALLLSVCIVIIILPFLLISLDQNSGLPPMLPYLLTGMLLPWIAVPIAPAVVVNKIRQRPCTTLIGRDYVLLTNRHIGLNDRYELNAEKAKTELEEDGNCMRLCVQYSFKAGRTLRTLYKWVEIPVPAGKEPDAVAFAHRFCLDAS